MEKYDAIVLGGGAAGLMCALTAATRGRNVLLLEHNPSIGNKIRISGGGRCNFTNLHAEPDRYLSENPRFCHSAFARYTPADFVQYVERHKIAYHEKKLGQLFCDGSAQQIIDALVNDCKAAGVDVRCGCHIDTVERADTYSLKTSLGEFTTDALVVATGGLSIPKMGASDLGYRVATQFGLHITDTRPGLVPLTLDEDELSWIVDLSGISFDAIVSIGSVSFEEAVLITHRGLSGPAILQISSYWNPGDSLTIDLFPNINLDDELMRAKKNDPKASPKAFLARQLPSRLADGLCQQYEWSRPLGETRDAELRAMAERLQHWTIPIPDTEGFAKAEVTCGGIDTKELSPKTMESRSTLGLYFIGEVVDVTGWLGGYNFQWAWSSAVAAGDAL
jgi:hypothetical protein